MPVPLPKINRRQRKRKSKMSKSQNALDTSNETSSNKDSFPRINTQIEKTKVYSPLVVYLKLNLKPFDVYSEFEPYLLTSKEIQRNKYPRESSDCPGRIIPDPRFQRGSTDRCCCRCSKSFTVLADGQYQAESACRYHPDKQLPDKRGNARSGDFPCCQGNFMSEGCVHTRYHVSVESFLHDVDFVKFRNKRHLSKVTASTVYALDCEMLYTTLGMEVAKVGIVGVDGLTVYESFVLPQNKILDYNTRYSGVSEKDLKGVTTTLADVHAYLLKLLNQESILVGHGLENDLKALRLIHEKVVDTSVVFPLPNGFKNKLKNLAKIFLDEDIQQSADGHDCIEDARTCMELMLQKISVNLKDSLSCTQEKNNNEVFSTTEQPQQEKTLISATGLTSVAVKGYLPLSADAPVFVPAHIPGTIQTLSADVPAVIPAHVPGTFRSNLSAYAKTFVPAHARGPPSSKLSADAAVFVPGNISSKLSADARTFVPAHVARPPSSKLSADAQAFVPAHVTVIHDAKEKSNSSYMFRPQG